MNRISQYLVYPIVRFFSGIFLKVEFRNPDGFVPIIGTPAIIIGNHITFYDSFLLRLNKHWTSLNVYFMGVTKFNVLPMRILWYIGIIPLIYFFFGVFVVVPGRGLLKNLEAPRKILAEGDSHVFIFPEGSMNPTGTLRPFKLGAATLATLAHVPVLPISYKEIHEAGKRKRIIITLGEVMNFPTDMTPEQVNKQLEERISEMLTTS